MSSYIDFYRLLIIVYLVYTKSIYAFSGTFSNVTTNKDFCFFKSMKKSDKMSSCKFECWDYIKHHIPLRDQALRQSIVSLTVQITSKQCRDSIGVDNVKHLSNLQSFIINGHLRSFNLTALLHSSQQLKQLMISSSDLNHLFMDELPSSVLTSINILGGFDPEQWQFLQSARLTLTSFYLALNRRISIPTNMFFKMPNIEYIFLHIVSDKISTDSISNLPKLTFLSINNNYYHLPIKVQKNVLSNLPALRTLKIINFDIEHNSTNETFCSALSNNIHYFSLDLSSIMFIERCPDVWRCNECGTGVNGSSQTMEFKSLSMTYKPQYQMKVDDILPTGNEFRLLNTSRLVLIDTHIPLITSSSLARFPLLTHYHHHRSWRMHENNKPFNSIGDIDRFEDNPFENIVNSRSKLTEVKISILECDCVSYRVYRFLVEHGVHVYFYCRNLAIKYESCNTDSWIPAGFYTKIMEQRCAANVSWNADNGTFSFNSTKSGQRFSAFRLGLLFSCLCFLLSRFYE